MSITILALFWLNAISHVISFVKLNKTDDPIKNGVLAFVFINAIIAILLYQGVTWGKYPALIFPMLGGMALLVSTLLKGKGTWIDFVIFGIDVVTIGLVIAFFFIY